MSSDGASRTIVCYGDSNTWGFDPATAGRFPRRGPPQRQPRLSLFGHPFTLVFCVAPPSPSHTRTHTPSLPPFPFYATACNFRKERWTGVLQALLSDEKHKADDFYVVEEGPSRGRRKKSRTQAQRETERQRERAGT